MTSTNELIALLVTENITRIPDRDRRADVLEVIAPYFGDASRREVVENTARMIRLAETQQLDLPRILSQASA